LSDVKSANYDVIFYIGGHGPIVDLIDDEANEKFASEFYQTGKITAAVCHGTAYASFSLLAPCPDYLKGLTKTPRTPQENPSSLAESASPGSPTRKKNKLRAQNTMFSLTCWKMVWPNLVVSMSMPLRPGV
jgi:hypothetical protein